MVHSILFGPIEQKIFPVENITEKVFLIFIVWYLEFCIKKTCIINIIGIFKDEF